MAVPQLEIQLEPHPPEASSGDATGLLLQLAGEVDAVLAAAQALPAGQQAVLGQLRAAIEALHREALLRLIRGLRADSAAAARLKELVRDPLVFGVLRLHGLVRDPLEGRVREALQRVEPLLAQHGGGVELVAIAPPSVHVRLTGACNGCPASGQTLSEGVQRAILEHVPEITRVVQVGGAPGHLSATGVVSPFARAGDTAGFIDVCALEELTEGKAQARTVDGREVLLYREGGHVSCVDNACAHMGMPLAGGEVQEGIIRCPHHGFRYHMQTGECLTVPHVQLVVHTVQMRGARVAVKLDG